MTLSFSDLSLSSVFIRQNENSSETVSIFYSISAFTALFEINRELYEFPVTLTKIHYAVSKIVEVTY